MDMDNAIIRICIEVLPLVLALGAGRHGEDAVIRLAPGLPVGLLLRHQSAAIVDGTKPQSNG